LEVKENGRKHQRSGFAATLTAQKDYKNEENENKDSFAYQGREDVDGNSNSKFSTSKAESGLLRSHFQCHYISTTSRAAF